MGGAGQPEGNPPDAVDINGCVLSHSVSSDVPSIPKTAVDAYLYLLQNSKHSDVTFIVGKEQKEIPCHSVFLMARSTVFEAGIQYKLKGEKPSYIVVNDVSPDLFESFLKFIYGDFLEATATEPLLQLLELGLKYKVELLSEKCVFKLCSSDMTPEDAIKALHAGEKFKLEELRASAIDQLVASLGTLSNEPELLAKLDEPLVRCILERNDLPLKEVEVFNFLVKWGKTQIKVKGNIQRLQDTLDPLLRLIRFPIMSPEEFGGSVASSGLLPSKTLVQLFIYFTATGEPWERAASSLEYCTKPRDGIEDSIEAEIPFYSNEHRLEARSTETCEVSYLGECIRFTVNHPPSSSVSAVKTKVLLNSITLQWPERVTYCPGKPSGFASQTERTITIAGPHVFGRKIRPYGPKRGRYRGNRANPPYPSYKVDMGRGRPITVISDFNEATDLGPPNPRPTKEPANHLQGLCFNVDLYKQVESATEAPVANIQEIFQSRPFSSASINPLFRMQLKQILERPGKEGAGPITSMVTVFAANSLVMKEGETVSIDINPPVELLDGKRNLILLEEESFVPFSGGQYRYAAVGNLQTSADVKLKNCSLQISDIHRNDPKPFVGVADKFSDVPIIQTLSITYAISTSKVF